MTRPQQAREDEGPGVPEAVPRVLQMVSERLDPDRLDRIWIFPPLVRGRRERGLVAVSRFVEPADDVRGGEDSADGQAAAPDGEAAARRLLFIAPYTAERTGKGLTLETDVREQGSAPPDRLPRIMDGVVRRSGEELGEPREVDIGGRAERFEALMQEFDPGLLEETVEPEQ